MTESLPDTTPQVTYPHRPLALTSAQFAEAKTRYLAGESAEVIALELGCKRGTLDARLSRAGLPKIREARLKEGRGQRTKDKIAAISEQIVDELSKKTPKSPELLNLHADTLAKATKTAALVHGWSENSVTAIIVAGDITGRREDPAEESIEVESEVDSGTNLAPSEE